MLSQYADEDEIVYPPFIMFSVADDVESHISEGTTPGGIHFTKIVVTPRLA